MTTSHKITCGYLEPASTIRQSISLFPFRSQDNKKRSTLIGSFTWKMLLPSTCVYVGIEMLW